MKQAKWPPKWCCWFRESARRADDEKVQVHKAVAMAFNSHTTVSGFSALDWSLRPNYKIIYSKCCLSFQQSLVINDRKSITYPICVPVDEQRLNSGILKCSLFFFFFKLLFVSPNIYIQLLIRRHEVVFEDQIQRLWAVRGSDNMREGYTIRLQIYSNSMLCSRGEKRKQLEM